MTVNDNEVNKEQGAPDVLPNPRRCGVCFGHGAPDALSEPRPETFVTRDLCRLETDFNNVTTKHVKNSSILNACPTAKLKPRR